MNISRLVLKVRITLFIAVGCIVIGASGKMLEYRFPIQEGGKAAE